MWTTYCPRHSATCSTSEQCGVLKSSNSPTWLSLWNFIHCDRWGTARFWRYCPQQLFEGLISPWPKDVSSFFWCLSCHRDPFYSCALLFCLPISHVDRNSRANMTKVSRICNYPALSRQLYMKELDSFLLDERCHSGLSARVHSWCFLFSGGYRLHPLTKLTEFYFGALFCKRSATVKWHFLGKVFVVPHCFWGSCLGKQC